MKQTMILVRHGSSSEIRFLDWYRKAKGDIRFCSDGMKRAYPASENAKIMALTVNDKHFPGAGKVEIFYSLNNGGYNVELPNGEMFLLDRGIGFLRYHFGRVLGKFWIKFEVVK